jgi:hypothetical protein
MKKQESRRAIKVNKQVTSWFIADSVNILAQTLLVANTEAGL